MISLPLATRLKSVGLTWKPALHDFFTIPNSDLDQRIFVVSDMTIDVRQLLGHQTITFNGAVEWSLDYIRKTDAVWLPTEEQLRELLQDLLLAESQPAIELSSWLDHYRCQIEFEDKSLEFDAVSASDAYGHALLHVLQQLSAEDHRSTRFRFDGTHG